MQDRHDREQRALDAISRELADSDPGLAGQLGTFNRLVSAEEMPGRDSIPPAPRPAPGKPRNPRWPRSPRRRLPLAWIAMLVWLLIAIALIAVALLLGHSGRASASASVGTSSAHARAVTTAISATRAMSM
jgi:Protein of unknown function (DUF3040)